jgi:uncharacterized membrane protein
MIEKNVGGYDRIARALLAVVAAAVGVAAVTGVAGLEGTAATVTAAVAFIATAGLAFNVVTQRCFGNALLGIDTCKVD